MRKSEIKDNNIFMWATKELSQDAVVAWLLNSELGGKFVNALLRDECPDGFTIEDIETQKESIDVFVTLKVDDEYQAIIIEDKTNTFLHNNQMLRYIEKAIEFNYKGKPYSKIYFVLFKTGAIYTWEKDEYNKRRKQIKREQYEIEALNDYYSKDKHLIMSGTYYDDKIDLSHFCGKEEDIKVLDIFDYDSFASFLSNQTITNNNHSNDTLELIKQYYPNNKSECDEKTDIKNKIYSVTKDFLKTKNKDRDESNKYRLRMLIPPGNGEREYDGCILTNEYIHFIKIENEEFTPKAMKIGENYLVLPFIRFVSDSDSKITQLEFGINYSLISNLKKLHGYQSYKETVKSLEIKSDWYENEKRDLQKNLKEEILKDYTDERFDKRNRQEKLKFVSWKINVNEKEYEKIIKDNLNDLLNYADNMALFLSHNKKD